MSQRILITGGAGYIGSHTCLLLLEKGYELIIFDSFINSSINSLYRVLKICEDKKLNVSNRLKIIKGDLRNKSEIDKLFIDSKISSKPINAVIHFAGLKAVAESVINPILYWDMNVKSTINLLTSMYQNNCKKIIFSSSATIYKFNGGKPLTEDAKKEPSNPYGSTKLTVENFLNDIFNFEKNDWSIANLRYFNPIGAHPSGLIGENPFGSPNNLFPIITRVAQKKIKKLSIFGQDWPTRDGTCIRDYIHVLDLAEGHLKTLEYLNNKDPHLLNLNLGTGEGTSVLELVKIFQKVNNIKVPFVFEERRQGDVSSLVASNKLAKRLLKWTPKINIEQACLDGWKWQTLNPNGF